MRHFKSIMSALAVLAAAAMLAVSCNSGKPQAIKTEIPARPAGQEDVLGLRLDPIDTVKIGFVGLGGRGSYALYRYLSVPWTKIVALCDIEPDRVEKNVNFLKEHGIEVSGTYTGNEGYKELCKRDDIDLVYICTDWVNHAPVALEALNNGKNVACEVPSATSLAECWALVNAAEKNRRHCMMLENCCYDFFELSALEMARQGVFGDIIHAEGAYCHNLTDYWDGYWRNWRLEFNSKHKGDVYPTHGLGPVCQALNIHRGDRMKTLVAMDTPSANGIKSVKRFQNEDMPDFKNGDLTATMILTEKGKSILIEHDVMTPRPYNRMYQLVGTEGYAAKYPVEQWSISKGQADSLGLFLSEQNEKGDGLMNERDRIDFHGALPEDVVKKLQAKYPTPILDKDLEDLAKRVGGHGGMDFLMDYRLNYCLHYGLPLDMDVYDLAEWCCIGELGAISIANGCAPVEVPDFTRGAWDKVDGFKYAFADGSMK